MIRAQHPKMKKAVFFKRGTLEVGHIIEQKRPNLSQKGLKILFSAKLEKGKPLYEHNNPRIRGLVGHPQLSS